MATIIETSGGFIAGDPPTELPDGRHWCTYCGGDGLEYSYNDDGPELGLCSGCWGACTVECEDAECTEHAGYKHVIGDVSWCARCSFRIYAHEHDGDLVWCDDRTPTNVCGEAVGQDRGHRPVPHDTKSSGSGLVSP